MRLSGLTDVGFVTVRRQGGQGDLVTPREDEIKNALAICLEASVGAWREVSPFNISFERVDP